MYLILIIQCIIKNTLEHILESFIIEILAPQCNAINIHDNNFFTTFFYQKIVGIILIE